MSRFVLQVDISEMECPSMGEVEDHIRQLVAFERADSEDHTLAGELEDQSGAIPVFYLNPAIQYFCDIQRPKGKTFAVKHTGWGPFIVLSHDEFDDFISFKAKFDIEQLLLLDIPLQYFLKMHDKPVNIKYHTENVVQVNSHVKEQYNEWLQENKDRLE